VFLSLDLGPDIHLPGWFVHLRRLNFLISNLALRFDVECLKETQQFAAFSESTCRVCSLVTSWGWSWGYCVLYFLTVQNVDRFCVYSLSENRETLRHWQSIVSFLSATEVAAFVFSKRLNMYGLSRLLCSQWHRQNNCRCPCHINCSQNHIRLRRITSANFSAL
jgi:hypothetical protein